MVKKLFILIPNPLNKCSRFNEDKFPIAQVFSSRQNLSTDIHVGNAASGDLDHLKMITYLVRLV